MKKGRIILISSLAVLVIFPSIFFPIFYLTPYTKPALVTSIVVDSIELPGNPVTYYQCNLNISMLFSDSCSSFKDYSVQVSENKFRADITMNALHRPRSGPSAGCLLVVTYLTVSISVILFRNGNWTICCNNQVLFVSI